MAIESRNIINISRSGPAGLAAALVIQRAGGHARVYERQLDQRLRKFMRVAEINRWIYQRLGNKCYLSILDHHKKQDAREWMHRAYRPRWWTPLMHYRFVRGNKKLFLHIHDDCNCTWCRYTGHARKYVSAGEHEGLSGTGI